MQIKENEPFNYNRRYSLKLDLTKDSNSSIKSFSNRFDMTTKDDENNHTLNHNDLDTLSDAGTYVIDDDQPICSTPIKRYVNQTKTRHGTFDIHGLISSTSNTINRPIVDSTHSSNDICLSSSRNSLSNENIQNIDQSFNVNQIKPSECFVISPVFGTKHFPNRSIEIISKSKFETKTPSQPRSLINDETNSLNNSIEQKQEISKNKSFSMRQPQTNLLRPTQNRQHQTVSKSLSSQSLKSTNSNGQINRTVQLRRARAQEKIEQMSQRSKKQFQNNIVQQNDLMSVSCHSNFTSQQQDMHKTRTISIDQQQFQKRNENTKNIEKERCDTLRDNGQRLAIKLIKLSSEILEKLKLNDDETEHQLEQLVHKLQMVNRTLTFVNSTLTNPINGNNLIQM